MKVLHDLAILGVSSNQTTRRCNMADYKLGFDVHKRYTQIAVLDEKGKVRQNEKVLHSPERITNYLREFPAGTPVAFETTGNWYWIADAIEAAECEPYMAHAAKAKVMMGNVNKTDKLDAEGLARLLYLGQLPTVWIPDAQLRDEREVLRLRMFLAKIRTGLKNRIHASLSKYALSLEESDIFVGRGLEQLQHLKEMLPIHTREGLQQQLDLLEQVQKHIDQLEKRIRQAVRETPAMRLLKSLPGLGDVLSALAAEEMGSVERFPDGEHFASYAGCVPTVASSGGKTHYGHLRHASNHYLKWAFIEAANVIVANRHRPTWQNKHVVLLYERIRQRKGHATAVGAVARHLAEAAYWMLRKNEPYRPPTPPCPDKRKRATKLVP